MHTDPKGYVPGGQLKECDKCGFAYRWAELRNQKGYWVCKDCWDEIVRKGS